MHPLEISCNTFHLVLHQKIDTNMLFCSLKLRLENYFYTPNFCQFTNILYSTLTLQHSPVIKS